MDIRLSCGSEVQLGLRKMRMQSPTETIYLMTRGICQASCSFCTQARSADTGSLSRVTWNVWEFGDIVDCLQGQKRVCIQCLNYPAVFDDLMEIVRQIRAPVSVSAQPFTLEEMRSLSRHVDHISISLDCFTPSLFERYKSFYNWELHWARMRKAVEIFGRRKVISHLIVGLGETEEEAVATMAELVDMGVLPSLFAFTPVRGTAMAQTTPPDLGAYRRLQIARQLLVDGTVAAGDIACRNGRIVSYGTDILCHVGPRTFMTQGCPHCNRPYYNEVPGRELYNYPGPVTEERVRKLIAQAGVEV